MEEIIEISTSHGSMYIWLFKETPLHRENFLKLAKSGYYDSTMFHRCIRNFMIQGGDPNTKAENPVGVGQGGPGYTVPAEIKDSIRHVKGALAAARTGDAINPTRASSGSQFYICVSTEGTRSLNGAYTVYGMVMKGIEVADAIVSQPTRQGDRPIQDIRMKVRVITKTKEEIKAEYGYDIDAAVPNMK